MSGLVPRLGENLTRAGRQPSEKVSSNRRGWKMFGWAAGPGDNIPLGYSASVREQSTTLLVGKDGGGACYAHGAGHAAVSPRG